MANVGRPKSNAFGSTTAGTQLASSLRRHDLSQAELSRRLMVSTRTVGRWLNGTDGPDPDIARRLAEELSEPELRTWWSWPTDTGGAPGEQKLATVHRSPSPAIFTTPPSPGEEPLQGGWRTRLSRRPLLVAAVLGCLLVIGTVLVLTQLWEGKPSTTPVSGTQPESTDAQPIYEGQIDGRMSGGRPAAHDITVWSLPSTTTGCDISPCLPGTAEAGHMTLPASVKVVCVSKGQQIRNGAPGEPGFYRDDRWLRLSPAPEIQNPTSQVVFLSNIWFERDQLPADLPTCAGEK
ncbi:hypothetical protein GCM10022223_05610 [Kineosporia mesophila]|uniref:HTH cro/C1-type domain-containing protein n=1 Tax=Kineosporia mesophila TaxID=566012 RepID=A0ABP6YYX8_9ACTN|nr:helix-turn-helix transcriptional regulator [Kineosporia mesophila]MCD5355228.1 helix-turn-helix domain-containing protein [Kineosporia mesophila]